jgi:hypothetical protein
MSLTLTNINISFLANHLSAILCLENWHDRYAVYDYLPNLSAGSLMFVTLALPPTYPVNFTEHMQYVTVKWS